MTNLYAKCTKCGCFDRVGSNAWIPPYWFELIVRRVGSEEAHTMCPECMTKVSNVLKEKKENT